MNKVAYSASAAFAAAIGTGAAACGGTSNVTYSDVNHGDGVVAVVTGPARYAGGDFSAHDYAEKVLPTRLAAANIAGPWQTESGDQSGGSQAACTLTAISSPTFTIKVYDPSNTGDAQNDCNALQVSTPSGFTYSVGG